MRASRLVSCTSLVFLSLSITTATECPNLTNVNFGPCMMIVGWGWNGNECVELGGCGTSDFEGIDYSEYIFWNYDDCMNICPCIEGYVECFMDPCEVTFCPTFPYAICESDYCGGCNANFYQNGELVNNECSNPCSQELQGSGDVTQDGELNVLDIVMTVSIILSEIIYTEEELCILDMNQDSIINVLDIILIIDVILHPDVSVTY